MSTCTSEVAATDVRFEGDLLTVFFEDGRQLSVSLARIPWLRWLREATPDQRGHWTLEPRGFAVYWPDLDDGIEVRHLLTLGHLG